MKHLICKSAVLLIFILSFYSCTVEKRLYMSGYNVEWKLNKNKFEKEFRFDISKDKKNTQAKTVEQPENNYKENFIASSNNDEIFITKKNNFPNNYIRKNITEKKIHKKIFDRVFSRTPPKKTTVKKIDGFGIASLILGIASVVLIFTATSLPVLVILSAFAAIVLSRISIKKLKENPNYFKGRGYAVAGFVLAIISLALIIIILAKYVNLFSGFF